jgi:hypothetical protein
VEEFSAWYLIWHSGLLTNEKIGAIFDLTYSSISHSVRSVRARMARDHKFKDLVMIFSSQFNLTKIADIENLTCHIPY